MSMCLGRGRTRDGEFSIAITTFANAIRLNAPSVIPGNTFFVMDTEIRMILKSLIFMLVISVYLAKVSPSCCARCILWFSSGAHSGLY